MLRLGLIACVVIGLALSAGAGPKNSGADPRPESCGLGQKPWLDVPRHPGHQGEGFKIAPTIAGCKNTPWGPLQIIAFRTTNELCWSADLPRLGLSQGASCLAEGDSWNKRCGSICISTVARVAKPGNPGTLAMGELKTAAKVTVEGGKAKVTTSARGLVVGVEKYLDADPATVRPAVFAAILPRCVGGRTVRATAELDGAKSVHARYGLPLSRKCSG